MYFYKQFMCVFLALFANATFSDTQTSQQLIKQTKWQTLNEYIEAPRSKPHAITLAERETWFKKLAWVKSCEDDFVENKDSYDDDYSGMELIPLDDNRLLMAINCRLAHSQMPPQATRLFFIHNTKTDTSDVIKLPGFAVQNEDEEGYLLETPNPPAFVNAAYRFDMSSNSLIVLQKYRDSGDCGLYAEYQFTANNEVITTLAREHSCERVDENHEFDIDSWPEIQLSDHSESEWLGLINAEKLVETDALCKQLQASEIVAKQAQGYQCQAWLSIYKTATTPKEYNKAMNYYAKAIALTPKDKSLYIKRVVLGGLVGVSKDSSQWVAEGIKALPYPQYIEHWLGVVSALQFLDKSKNDALKVAQVIDTAFPKDKRVLSKIAEFE